jgi:hypothetical protein
VRARAPPTSEGGEMVVAETTFLDVFWWMIVMFFWVMAI